MIKRAVVTVSTITVLLLGACATDQVTTTADVGGVNEPYCAQAPTWVCEAQGKLETLPEFAGKYVFKVQAEAENLKFAKAMARNKELATIVSEQTVSRVKTSFESEGVGVEGSFGEAIQESVSRSNDFYMPRMRLWDEYTFKQQAGFQKPVHRYFALYTSEMAEFDAILNKGLRSLIEDTEMTDMQRTALDRVLQRADSAE